MSQHTQGPWTIDPKLTYLVNRGEDGRRIAYIAPNDQVGNARLIAAAPELLEACLLLVADYEDENSAIGDDWYRKAKAAIAKARGEA